MNKKVLLLLTSFIFSIHSHDAERKIEANSQSEIESQNNEQNLKRLFCSEDYLIRKEFDTKIIPVLQNIILNYLADRFVVEDYKEADRRVILAKAKIKIDDSQIYLRGNNKSVYIQNGVLSFVDNFVVSQEPVFFGDGIIFNYSIAYLGNNYLASSNTLNVRIWNLNTGMCEKILPTSGYSLLTLPDNCLAVGTIKSIEIWDLNTQKLKKIIDVNFPAHCLLHLKDEDFVSYSESTIGITSNLSSVKKALDIIDSRKLEIPVPPNVSENLQSCNGCCIIQ